MTWVYTFIDFSSIEQATITLLKNQNLISGDGYTNIFDIPNNEEESLSIDDVFVKLRDTWLNAEHNNLDYVLNSTDFSSNKLPPNIGETSSSWMYTFIDFSSIEQATITLLKNQNLISGDGYTNIFDIPNNPEESLSIDTIFAKLRDTWLNDEYNNLDNILNSTYFTSNQLPLDFSLSPLFISQLESQLPINDFKITDKDGATIFEINYIPNSESSEHQNIIRSTTQIAVDILNDIITGFNSDHLNNDNHYLTLKQDNKRSINLYINNDLSSLGSASFAGNYQGFALWPINVTINVSTLENKISHLGEISNNNTIDVQQSPITIVLIHEILHALGIGKTQFAYDNDVYLSINSLGHSVYNFSSWRGQYVWAGQNGVAGYKNILKAKYSSLTEYINNNIQYIPFEDDYGDGTAESHPEEEEIAIINNGSLDIKYPYIENEIMTGVLSDFHSNSVTNYEYITEITTGMLQDIGYIVNTSSKYIITDADNLKIGDLNI